MDELFALAEEHDGLLISKEARAAGIQDSVLVRLGQRGRLERMTRGVYRIRSIIDILLANRGREVLVLAVSLRWHRKEHDLLGATLTSAPRTPVTFTLLLRRYLLPEPIPCPNAKQKPRRTSSTSKRNRDEDESSFEKVSRKWWAWWSISKSPRQAETLMNRLEADVFPTIGNLPTDAVLTTHIRDTMLTIETRGARDVAKRSNQFIGQIVRFAIARELASRNPAADFRPRDVLAATESENFAHVDEKYLPDLLVKTDGYNGDSWTERRDD